MDPAHAGGLLIHEDALWRAVSQDKTAYARLLEPQEGATIATFPLPWLYPAGSTLPVTMDVTRVTFTCAGQEGSGLVLDDGMGTGLTFVHTGLEAAMPESPSGSAMTAAPAGPPLPVLVDQVLAATIMSPALDALFAASRESMTAVRHLLVYRGPE